MRAAAERAFAPGVAGADDDQIIFLDKSSWAALAMNLKDMQSRPRCGEKW